jgi:thymidylate synthase ThyX
MEKFMAIEAKIILDSISSDGVRLTSFSLKYPKFILAELNTHRNFSRSTASSRAIPVKRILEEVKNDPVLPVFWGKNKTGMQAEEELDPVSKTMAQIDWLDARDAVIKYVEHLIEVGLHKQTANRLLEPWFYTRTIVTATEWDNFWNLRCHKNAQPEMRTLAELMRAEYQKSKPKRLLHDEWHLPYLTDNEIDSLRLTKNTKFDDTQLMIKCSVARCARVSYMNHDGTKPDEAKDIELFERLLKQGHMSAFEHVATPAKTGPYLFVGNFKGWTQYRKMIPNEAVFQPRDSK